VDDTILIVSRHVTDQRETRNTNRLSSCTSPLNQDQGAAYTCRHDNGGINVTIAVLGPYNRADRVEVIWDKVSEPTRTTTGTPILADYRRQRPDTPFIVSVECANEDGLMLIVSVLIHAVVLRSVSAKTIGYRKDVLV